MTNYDWYTLRPFHLFRTDSRKTWDNKKSYLFYGKRDAFVYPIESSGLSSFPLIFAEIEKQGENFQRYAIRGDFLERERAINNK